MYDPATDFLGLWRNNGASVSKMEIPGLDYVVAALARAGVFTLSVSATAPVVNQSTTAWLQAAVPSWSAEGAFFLWDKVTSAYLPATAALFLQLLEASAGASGVSWWTGAGAPSNLVGADGDFYARTDEPGGIYGPKVASAWPLSPIPGTVNEVTSTALDNTFGAVQGQLIIRGAAAWEALPIGNAADILVAGSEPAWGALTALMDVLFSDVQGSILYRDALSWAALGPGVAAQVLATGGPGAAPEWVPRTAEFPSGTVMVFGQTVAPVGWTKQVAIDDYGLRVVSGVVGTTPGTAFSTVFAQSVTGNHVLTTAEMPNHAHPIDVPAGPVGLQGGGTYPAVNISTTPGNTSSSGGGGAHNHPIGLTLAYTDVIMATKD